MEFCFLGCGILGFSHYFMEATCHHMETDVANILSKFQERSVSCGKISFADRGDPSSPRVGLDANKTT